MATTPRGVAVATVLAQAQLKYAEPSGRQSCCETVPSAPDSSHACLSLQTSHACVCTNKTQPAPSPQHSLSVSQRGPAPATTTQPMILTRRQGERAHAHEQLRAAIGSQTSDGDAVGLHRQGRSHPLSPPVHAPGGGGTHACVPASPEAHAQSRTDCTAHENLLASSAKLRAWLHSVVPPPPPLPIAIYSGGTSSRYWCSLLFFAVLRWRTPGRHNEVQPTAGGLVRAPHEQLP